jgi:acetyl esterase/lipase
MFMSKQQTRSASPAAFLRLILGAVSAGLASLAVVEARSWNQVVLTIGVTEWGHVIAPLGLAALAPGWRRHRAARAGAALGLVAAALSLSSLARAARLARRLPPRLAAVFGDTAPREARGAPARPAPLVALDVLRGVRSPKVRRDRLVYAARDQVTLALDLYRPVVGLETRDLGLAEASRQASSRKPRTPGTRPLPCVVVIHGGSWHNGDSGQMPELNRYLAARGYAVAAISYRLAPAHRFPAQLDVVRAAIGFLKRNAAALGIDPQRLVLLGRSAGGHLALLAAYTSGDVAIRGVVAFYAPTDMIYGYDNPARKRVIDGRAIIEAFLGGKPSVIRTTYELASPLQTAGAGCPPTLLIHGGRDNLVGAIQSEMLAERLAAAGCRHFYLKLPWATHGCDANFSGPSGQISTYVVERFLSAVIGY